MYLIVGAFGSGVSAGFGIGMSTYYSADKDGVNNESLDGTFRFIRSLRNLMPSGKIT
jgi:hypothetical protein